MPKHDVLFVIGAGASVASGVPAMTSFVDEMYRLYIDHADSDIVAVFNAMSDLRKVYANSNLDLRNIEAVLAAFDMGRLVGQLGRYSDVKTEELYSTLVRMIVETVEQTTLFDGEVHSCFAEGFYNELVTNALNTAQSLRSRVDFITLNYDIALDHTLASRLGTVNYGHTTNREHPLLLKLHGSVNWYLMSGKLMTLPERVSSIASSEFSSVLEFGSNQNGPRRVRKVIYSKGAGDLTRYIVPPSYSKKFELSEMKSVWSHAAWLLSNADTIVFIGYSVPESDLMVRYLFTVGTLNNDQIKRVVCLNKDPEVESVYRRFLGQYTNGRFEMIASLFDSDSCRRVFRLLR